MNYYIIEKAIEMQEIFKTQNPLMTYKILIEMKGGLKEDGI